MAESFVGNLFARLKLDATQFSAAIKAAQVQAGQLQKGIALAGAGFKGAAVATAAFGLALAGLIKVAGAFEQTMANVGAVTGATGDSLKELSDIAVEMGKATIFSASQAGAAMFALGSQGIKTAEDFRDVLKPALDLAAATQSEIASTTEAVIGNLRAFSLGMGEAGRVANVFSAANENSALTMERLTNALRPVAPLAGALGVSIEDTTAALGTLVNSNLQAEEAGTALRNIFLRLQKPVGDASVILNRVGLTTERLGKLMKDPIALTKALRDANLSGAEAQTIFGARALGAFFILRRGVDDMEKLRDSVTGTDSATRIAAKQLDTFNSQIKLLKSAAEAFAIEVGTELLPYAREIAKTFTDITKSAIEWFKANNVLVTTIIRFTGETLLLLTATLGAAAAITKVIAVIKAVKIAMAALNLASPWIAVAAALAIVVERSTAYFDKLADSKNAAASLANTNFKLAESWTKSAEEIENLTDKEKTLRNINKILAKNGLPLRLKSINDVTKATEQMKRVGATLIKQEEDRRSQIKTSAEEEKRLANEVAETKIAAQRLQDETIFVEKALSDEALIEAARGFSEKEFELFQLRKEAMRDLVLTNKITWEEFYLFLANEGTKFNDEDAARWQRWQNIVMTVTSTVSNALGKAFNDMATGAKTSTEAMKSFFNDMKSAFISAITGMIARAVVFLAIMSALRFLGIKLPGSLEGKAAGKFILGFKDGGIIGAQNGLLPRGEDMLIGVQRGEAVLSRAAVSSIGGAPAVNAINTSASIGGGVGGVGDTINITIQSLTGRLNGEDKQEIFRVIQEAKRRSAGGI